MIDETPRSYSIRCRRCADLVTIDVPWGVKTQTGDMECTGGHVTPYRFDGATIVTHERAPVAPSSFPRDAALERPHVR